MNLEIYNKVRTVPQEAKKTIQGGRLKGFTDINPMWRIKVLTEIFGPVGDGWYYEMLDKSILEGADGEKVALVDINLYVMINGGWSKPIFGTGGSSFISKERGGLYTNDECIKMALTDALGVACKALGVGADVYYEKDSNKYDMPDNTNDKGQSTNTQAQANAKGGEIKYYCSDCGVEVTQAVHSFSTNKLGKSLCRACQSKAK